MPALKNKTILILSPQSWGKMFVSKHHYAVELAKYGNTVYFLNPPDQVGELKSRIEIEKSEKYPGLFIISHRLSFPYNLKFHLMPLFHFLMKRHIKKIISTLDRVPDIIWSFDLGNLYPFRFFTKSSLKIFHPVDEPLNETAINSAKGADIIFSVTKEILQKYSTYEIPKYFINHGISESFFSQTPTVRPKEENLRVGFAGNLLRSDLDRTVFIEIIANHADIIFECWGSYKINQSNVGGIADLETKSFIQKLESLSNVILHGVISSDELANEYQRIDAFLICYDIEKDQSRGTNYHKVMEFLSTGKVVISNNITTYSDKKDLIQMTEERNTNIKLPALFSYIIQNLAIFNSPENQQKRIAFSKSNTYKKQVEKIQDYILNVK